MARVDAKDYQYYVDKKVDLFDRILILDILIAEGVQPGEVLRLVTRGIDGQVIDDRLYKMENTAGSYSIYHSPNQNVAASDR